MSEEKRDTPILVHAKTVDGKPLPEEEVLALQSFLIDKLNARGGPSEFAAAIRTLRIFLRIGMREFAERCLFRPSDYAAFEQGLAENFGDNMLLSKDIRNVVIQLAKAARAKAEGTAP